MISRNPVKRQRNDEELYQSHKLLDAISSAQSKFIADSNPSVLFNDLLNNLLSLTLSEYGFIGEVFYNAKGEIYLKTHALTNISWDKETQEFYERNSPEGMEFHNLKTLFGEVMITGRPVIANHPLSDPRRGGLPEGHPLLNAFLGLPFYRREKLVGMAGIANRPGGYNERLVEYLEPFCNTCANIIEAYRNNQQRRQTEEALQQSEEKYRDLFENANDAICIIDSELNYKDVNKKAVEIFGYSREELLNMNILDLIPPEQIPRSELEFDTLRRKGMYEKFVGKARKKDGSLIDVEVSSSAIKEGSKVIGSRDIIRDITERRQIEEELKVKAQLLDRATDSIFVHDMDGNFIYLNEAAYRSRGYTKDEIMRIKLNDLVASDYRGLIKKRIKDAVENGEAIFESAHTSKNKSIIPIEVHTCIIESEGRKLILGVVRDITERKRAEEMLKEKARAELYGFIVSALPVFASGVPSSVRAVLVSNFAERFERNIRPRFEEEMRRFGYGLSTEEKDVAGIKELLDIFMLWLLGLFSNFGIQAKIASDGTRRNLEFSNCPWMGEAQGNPVFCFICRTIVIRSFTWTSLKGIVDQNSSIANGSQICRFEIHI